MQDYTKAKNAANLMFELIEQVPEIDVSASPGAKPVSYFILRNLIYFHFNNNCY
jgi:hypothetical protein